MSQIIIVPFNDQEIGQGVNFDTRENLGTGLDVANISDDRNANGQIVRTSFTSVTTQESLMESLGISVSADARYGLFSGGAKMDFAQSHSVNSFSSFVVGRCEVHNATRHGHGFTATELAKSFAATDQEAFKRSFGNMFVRSLKTGGEFYVVARVTSVSEAEQSKLSATLHAEYNGLAASGSFSASFNESMAKTNNHSEVTVFMSQAGGAGNQASFTGPDAAKILERLSSFPQSVLEHPVGYEAELATYDTIPIPLPDPMEVEERNTVLADCLAQKLHFLKALSDLEFLLGPNGEVFFDGLPSHAELGQIEVQYRKALNSLMSHALKVAKGEMEPQVFVADPPPPPLDFKKRPVSDEEKTDLAKAGEAAAVSDPVLTAFRNLQSEGPRRSGFDLGIGITGGQTLWGPGKQRFLDSLGFNEQLGFRDAAAFALGRNNNPSLAAKGAEIAAADAEVATARAVRSSGLFWLGFDVATGIFADPKMGALGNTAMGPGSEKIRSTTSQAEHILLPSNDIESGFNASAEFHIARRH